MPNIPGQVTTASTISFILNARRNGIVWDLTDAEVTITLTSPSGMTVVHDAIIVDAANGIARYTTPTTELNEVGVWYRKWRVVKDVVDIWTVNIPQDVYGGG